MQNSWWFGLLTTLAGEAGTLRIGLLAVFAVGLLLGGAGVLRRSWGLLFSGLLMATIPMGFVVALLTLDPLP